MRLNKGGIKTWLIFILVIVIALGALFYFKSISKVPSEDVTEIEDTGPKKGFAVRELTEEEKADLDASALEKAINDGSSGDCEKITYNEELKQKCLDDLNYASYLRSGSEDECNKLFNKELRDKCLNSIYYSDALDLLDDSLCNKISDIDLKQKCLDQLQVIFGKNAESAEDCNSISNPDYKQECLNNFYYSASIDELDETSCTQITNTQLKERCLSVIAQNKKVVEISKAATASAPATTQEVLTACDNYTGDKVTTCKDETNYDLAYEEKDISYCNKISDTTLKKECVEKQTVDIDQYYFRQATTYLDAAMCQKIVNASLKTLCLSSIQ
ncbi:hypothetical protein JW758_05815 [Candidatus Peregrinibacteria bacterium]|nr:hypothetical protein [Candidatus Peregrinibacteria bacterium]